VGADGEPVLINLEELSELIDAGAELSVKMERLAEAQKLQVRGGTCCCLGRVCVSYNTSSMSLIVT
jgi:hypothetical protein